VAEFNKDDVPDWAAWMFGAGVLLLLAGAAASAIFDMAWAWHVPLGLLLMALGMGGVERAARRKEGGR
jgi:hypothetical protein